MPIEFAATLVKHALENFDEGESSAKMVETQMIGFLSMWARNEPAKAAAWAGSLSDEGRTLEAQLLVASMWDRYDPQETRRWAETLSPKVREAVLLELE